MVPMSGRSPPIYIYMYVLEFLRLFDERSLEFKIVGPKKINGENRQGRGERCEGGGVHRAMFKHKFRHAYLVTQLSCD